LVNRHLRIDLGEMRAGMYALCLQKQSEAPFNDQFKAGVLDKLCGCVADTLKQRMTNSTEFKRAAERGDEEALKQTMRPWLVPEQLMRVVQQCAERGGGIRTSIDPAKTPPTASTVMGLKGTFRRDSQMSLFTACVDGQKGVDPELKIDVARWRQDCDCAATYIVDHVSEADIAAGLHGDAPTLARMQQVKQAGTQACAKQTR
jgi:hypothetical protein